MIVSNVTTNLGDGRLSCATYCREISKSENAQERCLSAGAITYDDQLSIEGENNESARQLLQLIDSMIWTSDRVSRDEKDRQGPKTHGMRGERESEISWVGIESGVPGASKRH